MLVCVRLRARACMLAFAMEHAGFDSGSSQQAFHRSVCNEDIDPEGEVDACGNCL